MGNHFCCLRKPQAKFGWLHAYKNQTMTVKRNSSWIKNFNLSMFRSLEKTNIIWIAPLATLNSCDGKYCDLNEKIGETIFKQLELKHIPVNQTNRSF